MQANHIDLASQSGHGENRLGLASEDQRSAISRVEVGLLTKPVSGQEQAFPSVVPKSECEHSGQSFNTSIYEVLLEVKNDLGISVGSEFVNSIV